MQRVFFIILIIEFEKTVIVFGLANPRFSEQLNRVQLVKALTDSIIYFFIYLSALRAVHVSQKKIKYLEL